MPRIFNLLPYQKNPRIRVDKVLITPADIDPTAVSAAWSYAVQNTAKGLELPDYDAAVKLMLERHPSWQVIDSQMVSAAINLNLAIKDVPDNA